jgi:aspartokinase
MARIVQRFGSASVRNPERIGREATQRVARCRAQGGRVAALAAVIGAATGCRSALARTVVRRRIGAFDQRLTGSRELAMIAPS